MDHFGAHFWGRVSQTGSSIGWSQCIAALSLRNLIFVLRACLFHLRCSRILNPDRSLFWGPFWWPQLMSWGNHARSLQCRCEESVVQRCVGWDSQEGALHHANSLIGVGGSGKTSIESLQYRNACVPDVCVLLGNSQHVPVNAGDPIPNWTKTGTVEFDLINFYLMISIFCMFHLQEMWDDPNWDRFNIQYSFGLQATRRWAILTKMETEALPLTSFVAWPSAGTQFGSSFCNYFPWDLRNWVPLNSLVKHHSLWNGPNWPTGIINHVQAIQKLLYFVWSPQWHLYILLLANLLAFYLTYLLAFYLAYLLTYYLLKSSGTIWQTFWHFIWHIFWHSIWHFIWHSIWHTFWHSIWHIF